LVFMLDLRFVVSAELVKLFMLGFIPNLLLVFIPQLVVIQLLGIITSFTVAHLSAHRQVR
jgi:hypothetical protein